MTSSPDTLALALDLPLDGPDLAAVTDAADALDRHIHDYLACSLISMTARIMAEVADASDDHAAAAVTGLAQEIASASTVSWTYDIRLLWPDNGPGPGDIDTTADALGLDRRDYESACVIAHTELMDELAEHPDTRAYWASVQAQIDALPDDFEETPADALAALDADDANLSFDPNNT